MEVNEQKEINYQPLSNNLTIKQSSIHGLGLFATEDIKANHELGIIHHIQNDYIIRTPLGGFINHSNQPNCKKIKQVDQGFNVLGSFVDVKYILITNQNISKGDELTLAYNLYKI